MRLFFQGLSASISIVLISCLSFGQATKLISQADLDLSIKTVAVLPLVDNIGGIYGRPLTNTLKEALSADQQWTISEINSPAGFTPEDLEEQPTLVKSNMTKLASDALVAGRISKSQHGVSIKITLYSGREGLPTASETLSNLSLFELTELKSQVSSLAKRLRSRLPYKAVILGRKEQLVTINIGSASGIKPGDMLTALQVIKVIRHPKFGFLVGTENLTLGRIQIDKVEPFLSFGTITTERDTNAISTGVKVSVDNFIKYPPSSVAADGTVVNDLNSRADSKVAFGTAATEWVPERPPAFGKAGVMFGLGGYTINNNLIGTGGVTGSSQIVPSIHLSGEMWISPQWFLNLNIKNFVFTVPNGLSGSTPGLLNVTMSQSVLSGGYNFLMADDFFGPKLQITCGYSTMSAYIDGSSPTAFESMTFGGLLIGLGGSVPIPLQNHRFPLFIGGKLNYFMSPSVSEFPTSSGAGSSGQISNFSIFGESRIRERLNLRGELSFDLFSAHFSGTGTRTPSADSASHTITTLSGGVEYFF